MSAAAFAAAWNMLGIVGIGENSADVADDTVPGWSMLSADGDGVVAAAEPVDVGAAAQAGGVALSELRAADGGGLEQLFLALTADPAAAPLPPSAARSLPPPPPAASPPPPPPPP